MLPYPDIIRSGYTENGEVGPVAVASEIKDEAMNDRQSNINAKVLKYAKAAMVM